MEKASIAAVQNLDGRVLDRIDKTSPELATSVSWAGAFAAATWEPTRRLVEWVLGNSVEDPTTASLWICAAAGAATAGGFVLSLEKTYRKWQASNSMQNIVRNFFDQGWSPKIESDIRNRTSRVGAGSVLIELTRTVEEACRNPLLRVLPIGRKRSYEAWHINEDGIIKRLRSKKDLKSVKPVAHVAIRDIPHPIPIPNSAETAWRGSLEITVTTANDDRQLYPKARWLVDTSGKILHSDGMWPAAALSREEVDRLIKEYNSRVAPDPNKVVQAVERPVWPGIPVFGVR